MSKRKKLQVTDGEREFLVHLYRHFRIPTDQFPQRPEFAAQFCSLWNEGTGRSDSQGELLHYMVVERKGGRWVTFRGHHEPLRSPGLDVLTDTQWSIVVDEYSRAKVGSDEFLYGHPLLRKMSLRIARETGQAISEVTLLAAILSRRKAGWLPPHGPQGGDHWWSDIDQVS